MEEVSTRTRIKRIIKKSNLWSMNFENGESKLFDILEESEGRFLFRKEDKNRSEEDKKGEKEKLIADLKIKNIEDLESDIGDSVMAFSFVYRSPGSDRVQKIIIVEA